MASKKPAIKPAHAKREFKKELEGKMESALPDVKTKLGEKKFQRRIKKAAKILVQGLHNKDFSNNNGTANDAVNDSAKKIKGVKKSRAKKQELPSA